MATRHLDQAVGLSEVKLRFSENRGAVITCAIFAWVFFGVFSFGFALADREIIPTLGLYVLAWLILGGSIVLHVLAIRRLRRTLAANAFQLCTQCRHPLRGLADVGNCPECGENFDIQVVCTTWRRVAHLPKSGSPTDYWVRQFTAPATRRQRVFDVIFGLVMPVVCMIFDPIVFKGSGLFLDEGMLSELRWFAYTGLAVELIALGIWLQYGEQLGRWRDAVGGIMLGGAVVAALIGVTIFPLSLIGLFLLVGTLGFTPFLTSLVLARNAARALARGDDDSPRPGRRFRMGLGLLILSTVVIAAHAIQHEGNIKSMITINLDDDDPADNW